MAPRKVDTSPKKAAEKKPRRRQKKVKPVLKTPSVVKIKLKLPTANTADENVESEAILDTDIKEDKNPVTKNNMIVKRKYVRKKIVNREQAPVKKRRQAKDAAKKDTSVKTSSIGDNNAKCDKFPQVDENYYKILLANEVIKLQFRNKPKYVKEQPIEQVLQENKTIVKKKKVSNIKIDLKKNITNDLKPTAKAPGNTRKCRRPKKASTTTTSQESECKPTLPSKDDDNNIIENTNNAEKSPKRKTISKKPSKKSDCKSNLTSKDKIISKDDDNIIENMNNSEQSPIRNTLSKKPCKESECKPNLKSKDKISKDNENNIIENTNNAEQSPKRKTISIKPSKESECKSNLASKDNISKDDYNNIKPTKKPEQSTKQKQLPKQIPKTNSSDEIDCKANLTSKDKSLDNADDRIDTKNAKRKSKLSLNRKNVKVLKFNKEEKEICNSEILKNCNKYQEMITDASVENYNVDKCVDNSIEQASVSSCMSFAKDISSSSNTTFVTIHSNGLHCFDNKIPVVQLNKIKKKLKNKNVSSDVNNSDEGSESVVADYNLFENTVHDQQYSLGRKCRLSRSSSSSSEQNKMDNCPAIEANVADVTQSALRLSTSSTSSSSSSSSSSSGSSSSSSSSTSASGSMMRKNIDNGLTSENLGGDEKKSASSDDELKAVLRKLNLNIKKCDFNRIKLLKNTFENTLNKSKVKNVQDNMFKNDDLKEETVLRSLCQSIIQLEIDDVDKYFNHPEPQEAADIPRPQTPETYYSKESQVITGTLDRNEECIKQTNNSHQQYCPAKVVDAVAANGIAEKIDGNCYPTNNKSNYNSVCDNDDDDALSLFAESITGLESCRRNSTFNSEMSESEEYVPKPVVPHTELPRKSITYQPTKISNNIEDDIQRYKQKADSTSLLINSGNNPNLHEDFTIYEDRIGNFSPNLPKSQNIVLQNTPIPNKPRLMALYHRPVPRLKSLVFKGYCFFYIILKCKKPNCQYTHEYPNVIDVKNTLKRLTEESFIQEYMLVRGWPQIRRKYGLCFVEECIRRELTRILVEIAIDFITKTLKNSKEDNALKSEVVDNVLMYLNQVDLSICDDLLEYIISITYFEKVMLCDYFMSVIATSQNFSRFKIVFVKLTDFIYRNGRTFSIDVAESILERFCILPYDDSLARALLNILKNTNVTIFSNAKICYLEKQLQTSNSDLYLELKLLKDRALVSQPVMDNSGHSNAKFCYLEKQLHTSNSDLYLELKLLKDRALVSQPVKDNFGHNMDKNIIRTTTISPDTTDVNKTPIQTTFKRTVNIDKLQQLGLCNKTNTLNKPSTQVMNPPMNWTLPGISRISENANKNLSNTAENGLNTWKWKNRSIFDSCFKRNLNASLPVWTQRAPFKRHSDRSFEGSPTKFKRINGPYNFQRDLS